MTFLGLPLPVGEGQGGGTRREPLPPRCALTPALSRTREREHHGSPHRGLPILLINNHKAQKGGTVMGLFEALLAVGLLTTAYLLLFTAARDAPLFSKD